jgi:hypothetical protein
MLSTLIGACLSLVQASSSLTSPPVFARTQDEALASRFRDQKLCLLLAGGQLIVNVDLDGVDGVSRGGGRGSDQGRVGRRRGHAGFAVGEPPVRCPVSR